MSIINQTVVKSGIVFNCLFLFSFIVFAQRKVPNCKKVKTGSFYFYPADSKQQYMIVRNSFLQMEINLKTNDTSFWKINWQNDCSVNMKFIKSTRLLSQFEDSFFHSHSVVVETLHVKNNYCVFKQGLDSLNYKSIIDTLWFAPRFLSVVCSNKKSTAVPRYP